MLSLLYCLVSLTRWTLALFAGKMFPATSTGDPSEVDDTDVEWRRLQQARRSNFRMTKIQRRCNSLIDRSESAEESDRPERLASLPERLRRSFSLTAENVIEGQDVAGSGWSSNPRRGDQADAVANVIPPGDDDETTDDEVGLFMEPKVLSVPVGKDDPRYNMRHKRRGKCVIFSHEKFDNGQNMRLGTHADAERLEKTFTSLGFEVQVLTDLIHEDLKGAIAKLSKEDHSDSDCICVFVLTHGLDHGMLFAKDAAYKYEVIWTPFTADKCRSLAGKPKLFFFQACRGEKSDGGVVVRRSAEVTETDSSVATYKIPTHADFLIAHSTVQGFVSWRDPEEGTWYVKCLCEVLEEHWRTKDLSSMLTITARRVATEYQSFNDVDPNKHEQTQVPSVTSMLIRDLYFEPK